MLVTLPADESVLLALDGRRDDLDRIAHLDSASLARRNEDDGIV